MPLISVTRLRVRSWRYLPGFALMVKLLDWCDEASVVHWDQQDATLPAWGEAYRRMVGEGRASKVRFPSAAHFAYQIPPPRLRVVS